MNMYSQEILKFSSFLAQSTHTYTEIARFLVMNSFSSDGALCLYIGELKESGSISPVGGFGWSAQEYEAFTDVSFNDKLPVCDSIRGNEIVLVSESKAFYKQYPLMHGVEFSQPWLTGVAIPCYPLGGLVATFATRIKKTEPRILFFTAIGSLLGFYASRLPSKSVKMGRAIERDRDLIATALTNRQSIISEMLERGFNNAQIGLELGYSESLIRQETVVIYRKLGVSGRKAMQEIAAIRLENKARGETP